ncbi:MAG TPA: VWA domain-containing protein, partial [Candidatus Limnocylindrales bacterium]|nr:VWA domain-containing protein [Candidatus Limnocylindrales bacterium]
MTSVGLGLGAGSGGAPGSAPARRPGRRRASIPGILFVLGLAVLLVALARPQASVDLPHSEGTIILAFDVSDSMAADDLKPSRMEAAKAAATTFVQNQPAGVVIGLVAFSDAGLSVQAPTDDQGAILSAISRLQPERGTSLGQGVLASLSAIETAENPPPTDYYSSRSPAPSVSPAPVPPGSDSSALIILLTDGENTQPPDPATAAQAAANRGVRIDTVGIGTDAGTTLTVGGFKVHTQLDAAALQQVAQATGGTYFSADSAQSLTKVYADLGSRLVIKPQTIEVTAILAGGGTLLLVLGALSSLLWLGRLP